jgi:hypothetical protein
MMPMARVKMCGHHTIDRRMAASFFMLVCTTVSQSSCGVWIWGSESSPLGEGQQEDAFFHGRLSSKCQLEQRCWGMKRWARQMIQVKSFDSVLGAAEANHVRVAALYGWSGRHSSRIVPRGKILPFMDAVINLSCSTTSKALAVYPSILNQLKSPTLNRTKSMQTF